MEGGASLRRSSSVRGDICVARDKLRRLVRELCELGTLESPTSSCLR
jgi:hypothetical protein